MITERDILIIKHVENYGFITIEQAKSMYFRTNSGYDLARRRLNKLVKSNYFKLGFCEDTKEKVFYIGSGRKVTLHSMLLMNYYSRLIANNVEIEIFQKEKEWLNGAIRSDGFCIFRYGGYRFCQLIEVIVSHNDSNLIKYEKLINAGEVQRTCGIAKDEFPYLIVIDNVVHKKEISLPSINTIVLNFELNDIGKVFV